MDTSTAQSELLAEFAELVADDELPGRADDFMARTAAMVDLFFRTGSFTVADDPFEGGDKELALDSHLFYVMFWRMFDQTPAALIQDFAIRLRRILAKKIFKSVGDDVIFHHNVLFSSGKNIELGNGVFVNRHVMLDDRGPLTVGDHTVMAAGTIIETHTHRYQDFSVPLPLGGRDMLPVHIGSNCLLGYNAVILAGVTLGDRVIVGSNAVVTKDVPDRSIVGGVPAKIIKEIEPLPGSDSP